jgi:cytoskeletal protein CcmA (bactofilin family)
MFGSSKEEDVRRAVVPSSGVVNSLVKGTSVGGKIKCDSDIRIEGVVKGDLVLYGETDYRPDRASSKGM